MTITTKNYEQERYRIRNPARSGISGGWVVTAAVLVILGTVLLATGLRGVAYDPRLHNPSPGPIAESPFLGIESWPAIFEWVFIAVALTLLASFGVLSYRQRRMHLGLIVLCGVLGMAWMDPMANWVTFCVYNPAFAHFPTTWPYLRLAPLVEPLMVLPAYPMYYMTFGLLGWAIAKPFISGRRSSRWAQRRPVLFTFLVGLAVGIVWDLFAELVLIRAHLYFYSQTVGPVIRVGNSGYPLIWGFYQWWAIAWIAPLFYRDDQGRSHLLSRLSRYLPSRRGDRLPTSGRQAVAAVLLLSVIYVVPTALYGFIRIARLTHPNYVTWTFEKTKVYDPMGDLEKAGKPGPYYK